jgi:hypothetical protein
MSLQINYYVAPNDQFVVYDPNKKTNKTVSYSTLISKIRADVSTYNTGGTVTSISTSSPLTGGVITTAGTIGITQSGAVSDGYLSSADWNTFNNKTSNTGTVTSVGATVTGGAMAIANSPITTSGSLDFSFGGTAAEYISGEGNLITFPAIPQGDITAVVAGTGLTGGGTSGSVTLSIDSSVVTLSGTQALTNKSGNISQWTNDSGYTTNVGDITAVTATSPITGGGTSGDVTVGIQVASGSQAGALSSTDWTTFNNKQDSGSYITSLTGEATATGPGAASTTLNNASVTGKVLSGVNITGGTVVATDSILTAFGKVQNQINGMISGSSYQGTWNAATNTPTLTSGTGTQGNYYIVSVDGTTNLDGITDWFVGDWAIFGGTAWQQVDNTDAVVSVNGQTGAVSLTTDNVSEGAVNLYFTNARSRASLSFAAGSGAYNNTTGVITIPTNTSQLTNGSNFITLGSLSGTSPIVYNNSTGAISITQSGAAASGYLSSTDWNTFNGKTANTGTVTSVGGTGTVSGLTLTGTVTTSGSLTLGGTLVLTSGQITTGLGYTPYNATNPSGYTTNTGTVTSVGISHAGDAFTAGSAVTTAGTLAITMAGTAAQYINGVGNLITFPDIPQGDITAVVAGTGISGGGTSGSVTITNSDRGSSQNIFKNVAVSGQTTIVADTNNDTLTLAAGNNITLITDAATDTVTITANINPGDITGVTATSPLTGGGTSGTVTVGIQEATSLQSGYLSNTDWTTFNNKSNTTGTVTSVGGTGTVSGLTLSGTVTSSGNLTLGGTLALTSANVTGALGYTPYNATNPSGYTTNTGTVTSVGISHAGDAFTAGSAVTTAGTLAITMAGTAAQYVNGLGNLITFPSIPQGDITAVTASAPITGGGTSGDVTIGITQSATAADGYLSSTDWNTFNNKQNALTNPVTGTGTTNYVPKFTSASAIGNSVIYDDGTNVGIGTTAPGSKLEVNGEIRAASSLYGGTFSIGTSGFNALQGADDGGNLIIGQAGWANVVFPSGNVGIGTTSPVAKLQITDGNALLYTLNSSNNITLQYAPGNIDGQVRGQIVFDTPGSEPSYVNGSDAYKWKIATVGSLGTGPAYYNSDLRFLRTTRLGVTDSAVMTLNGFTGNVGIGTTSPGAKLFIDGKDTSNNSSLMTRLETTYAMGISNEWVSTYVSKLQLGRVGIGNTSNIDFIYDISGAEYGSIKRNYTASSLKFERGTTVDMIIDGSGNVGIGTTAPAYLLHVNGGDIGTSGNVNVRYTSNETYKGNSGFN